MISPVPAPNGHQDCIMMGQARMSRTHTLNSLITYIGAPCVYYGDEIGMEGEADPDNRQTMPWDETQWNPDLRALYQRLIAIRRQSPALKYGGDQLEQLAPGSMLILEAVS